MTDPTVPYVPKVIFERPVGVSHQMQAAKPGLWAPELVNIDSSSSHVEGPAMLAAPQPVSSDAAVEVAADEVKVLGVFFDKVVVVAVAPAVLLVQLFLYLFQ